MKLHIWSIVSVLCLSVSAYAAPLMAGVAKVDITNYDAGPVNDPSYVKALVLKQDDMVFAMISVDVVAIGEIGRIKNDYMPAVRAGLKEALGIAPEHVMVNASHCHSVVVNDAAVRIGDFVMVTFPGELTVQVGLNIKAASPHEHTFVAGYTNGYIYYAPTAEQLRNTGHAQEDCDTLLAPEWQALFEAKVAEMLETL